MSREALAAAIVVAGGSGERFGRAGGKQLAPVAGWPVLSWSLRALDTVEQIRLIVVVCPAERTAEYDTEAVAPLSLDTPVLFAASGETRQQSVASGLRQVPDGVEHIIVHDGARPLITAGLVAATLEALGAGDVQGAVVGHPSYDTLKLVESRAVVETPDRSRYWAVQTPQAFDRAALESAHRLAEERGFEGTDDAALVEHAGGRVIVVEGPRDNLKVTVPEDLAFVEVVLNHRREGRSS